MNEATAVYNENQTSVSCAFNNSSSKSIRNGAGQLLLGNRMTQETRCSWIFQFLGGVVGKTGCWQNLFFLLYLEMKQTIFSLLKYSRKTTTI